MFGKLTKKKSPKPYPKEKPGPKNDLFNLLDQPSEQIIDPKESTFEKSSKSDTPKPESVSGNSAKLQTVSEVKKPETDSVQVGEQKTKTDNQAPESSIKGDKSQLLLLELEKLPDKTIKPVVDFNDNCLFYPILSKIGQSPDDVSFLDELANEGTLKREILEKLIICPTHQDAFSSSVKLYCPKCNSLNVDKLHLFEHKRCGFITENTEYDFSDPKNSTCPSCKRKITDFKKEIRVPAMWHQCKDCKDKFDNAIIKMYCRQHEHDFDINSGQFVTTYSYTLKDYEAPMTSDDEQMREDLIKLLNDFNFSTEFKATVKGKTGNTHKVPIFAKNNSSGETIAVFIDRDSEEVSQSDINSILVPILDISPKHTLLLSTSEIEDGVKPTAKQYGIEIIADGDLSKIISHVEEFVSEKYSKNGEK